MFTYFKALNNYRIVIHSILKFKSITGRNKQFTIQKNHVLSYKSFNYTFHLYKNQTVRGEPV